MNVLSLYFMLTADWLKEAHRLYFTDRWLRLDSLPIVLRKTESFLDLLT
jgi:hypothetical protein